MDGSERRRHPRFDVEIAAVLHVKREREELVPAQIRNLSLSGAMLETDEPIVGIGQYVRIEVPAHQDLVFHGKVIKRDTVEFCLGDDETGEESVVRWSNGSGLIGIEFSHLSPESRKGLEHLLEHLAKKEREGKSG